MGEIMNTAATRIAALGDQRARPVTHPVVLLAQQLDN